MFDLLSYDSKCIPIVRRMGKVSFTVDTEFVYDTVCILSMQCWFIA